MCRADSAGKETIRRSGVTLLVIGHLAEIALSKNELWEIKSFVRSGHLLTPCPVQRSEPAMQSGATA